MVIGSQSGTLTRQYQIRDIVVALGSVPASSTLNVVQAALDAAHNAHVGLAARLFSTDRAGRTIDNEMHRSCREGRSDARLLVWAGLLVADRRMADAVETFLTRPTGGPRDARFDTGTVEAELDARGIGSARKAASNLLRYFEVAGVIEAERQGSSIVGIGGVLNTAHAVPGLVTFAAERVEQLEGVKVPARDRVDLALERRVNAWVLLTADQFRGAASAAPAPAVVGPDEAADDGGEPAESETPVGFDHFAPKDDSDYVARVGATTLRKSRQHETLVNDFAKWADAAGFHVTSPHPVDLSLQANGYRWIVEAKVVRNGNVTQAVREAVGQLFEYKWFLYTLDTIPVALFSEPIGEAFQRYLLTLKIRPAWREGEGWRGAPHIPQGRAGR